jgi:UDP-GlcNAc:undecaprenyl-phosphate GlcNAc-1-phosphate transferase
VVVLTGEFNFRTQIFDILTLSVVTSDIFFIVLFVFVINAFNLIDGIDGLACTLGILTNLFLGIVLLLNGDELYGGMALILTACLSGFLVFNHFPAKVYMGDSGSMVVGVISYLAALRFIELNGDILYSIHTSSIIALALFSVPIYDTLRVFLLRLLAGKSPFNRDQTHIHHRLRNLGLLDFQIVMLLVFYTLCMVSLVIIFQQIGDLLLCIFILASGMLFNHCIDRQLKKAEVKN